MKNQKTYYLLLLALMFVWVNACTDGFDQLNVNPNQPTEEVVPATNVLGTGFNTVSGILFQERLGIFYTGTYAGQTAPIGLGDYEFRIDINNNMWNGMYRSMSNFVDAKRLAERDGNSNMVAVATIMKAYTAQQTTDMWGDIPYSEAFQLEEGISNPVYDTQQQVYNQILSELKTAADMLNNGTGNIGVGDLIYGGNVESWKKFANSLRLRVAMRMSNVAPNEARAVISDVLGNPGAYPIMTSNSDNAYKWWPGVAPDTELWFRSVGNLAGNKTTQYRMNYEIIEALKGHNDPRLPVYADPNQSGVYNGYKMGLDQRINPMNGGNNVSHIGNRFGNNPAGFSPFMNVSEVKFILAEAYARELYTGNAREAYEAGITLSMQENGISAADVATFLTEPGVAWDSGSTSNLYKINLQKWIALFKQSVDAWSESRRTDVPMITNVSQEFANNHNRPPFRMAYPDVEQSLNENFPSAKHAQAQDTFWGFQLWWDTRTGVQ